MNSLILKTATRLLLGLMVLFSIFILLRGHNEPGGGFIGGLVAASGFALYAIAYGSEATKRMLHFPPHVIAAAGLGFAVLAGLVSILVGEPFLTGQWYDQDVGAIKVPLNSVLVFDIGVYLVVIGAILTIVLAMEEA